MRFLSSWFQFKFYATHFLHLLVTLTHWFDWLNCFKDLILNIFLGKIRSVIKLTYIICPHLSLLSFLWLFQNFLMTFSWLFHDFFMTFSWLSHAFLMPFQCFLMPFPWLSYYVHMIFKTLDIYTYALPLKVFIL